MKNLVLVLALWALSARADPFEMAVIGDSLSTGAVTHPALAFDAKVLWDAFSGVLPLTARREDLPADLGGGSGPAAPPRRLWPTPREFFGGPDWVWRHALQSLSRAYLDTAQYSWGYMVGRGLGVEPENITLAGEDGARMVHMPRHLDRILAVDRGLLPRRLFIFYTGNDLCGMSLDQVTPAVEFRADLTRGIKYLLRNGHAGEGGSDVYVLSYLGILQLLHSEAILAKPVRAFGDNLTCRDLRAAGYKPLKEPPALPPEAWYFSLLMPPNPAGFCPTLFGGEGRGREAVISALANRIRDYREQTAKAVAALAEPASAKNVRLHYVEATSKVTFIGEDIAEDCFHLTIKGQAKVARAVLTGIK